MSAERDPQAGGTVQELARDSVPRRGLLAAIGGGAGVGALVLAGCGGGGGATKTTSHSTYAAVSRAPIATHSISDAGILGYLLKVEELLVAFYDHTAAARLLSGTQARLVAEIAQQERAHVAAIRGAIAGLGGAVPKAGRYVIPHADAHGAAALAYSLENLAAAAYLGQAANFQSTKVLRFALTIHSVEARHAATVAGFAHLSPTPDGALAHPQGEQEVLSAITRYTP